MNWRDRSTEFVAIGGALQTIRDSLGHIRATAAVNEVNAEICVSNALRASRELVRQFEALKFGIKRDHETP